MPFLFRFSALLALLWLGQMPLNRASAQVKGSVSIQGELQGLDAAKRNVLLLDAFYGNQFYPQDTLVLQADGRFSWRVDSLARGLYQLSLRIDGKTQKGGALLVINPQTEATISLKGTLQDLLNGQWLPSGSLENDAHDAVMNQVEYLGEEAGRLYNKMAEVSADMPGRDQVMASFESQIDMIYQRANALLRQVQAEAPKSFAAQVAVPLVYQPRRSESPAMTKKYATDYDFLHAHLLDSLPWAQPEIGHHYLFFQALNRYYNFYLDTAIAERQQFVDRLVELASVNEKHLELVRGYLLQLCFQTRNFRLLQYFVEVHAEACGSNQSGPKSQTTQLLEVAAKNLPGKPAANPTLPLADGSTLPLLGSVGDHELTVLFFWMTTCHHCHEFAPELRKLYDQYRAKGLHVLSIALDQNGAAVAQEAQKLDFPWPAFHDQALADGNGLVQQNFLIMFTPTLLLVDRQGKLLTYPLTRHQLAQELHTRLGQ